SDLLSRGHGIGFRSRIMCNIRNIRNEGAAELFSPLERDGSYVLRLPTAAGPNGCGWRGPKARRGNSGTCLTVAPGRRTHDRDETAFHVKARKRKPQPPIDARP